MTELPPGWGIVPENVGGGFEAWRGVRDGHRFDGVSIQGTRKQCMSAARILELHRTDSNVLPLLREPPRALRVVA